MTYPTYLENNRKSQIVKNAISLVRLRLDWDLEVGEISKMESDHNDTTTLKELKENINSFYLINMSTLVFLMQCGFAFLEAGCVRSKNAINIIMKNMMDCLVASIAYWAIGYGIALVSKSLARKFKLIISPHLIGFRRQSMDWYKWFFQHWDQKPPRRICSLVF